MSTDAREIYCTLGERLREERDRLGFSQEDLADRLKTSRRTMNSYERNETSPRAAELLELSRIGADVLYIVTGARQPLGCAEGRTAYSPAERLAEFIFDMKLSEDDAALIKAMVERLAR